MSAMTRWQPLAELAELRQRLDRTLSELSAGTGEGWSPAVDVVREDGVLRMRANVPGLKPEEITVEVEADLVTISGEHVEETEREDGAFLRRERHMGAFSRALRLPHPVDPKKVKATVHDGVLDVEIPVPAEKAPHPVTITPKAA
jgi:HSP20 family protein